jgi:hypothetical protein
MLELIRRCKYCGKSMMSESPQSFKENPFCGGCLMERMAKAALNAPTGKWVANGNHLVFVPDKTD